MLLPLNCISGVCPFLGADCLVMVEVCTPTLHNKTLSSLVGERSTVDEVICFSQTPSSHETPS